MNKQLQREQIEVYAAQALNREAERHVAEIRVRAERKTGQLVREGQRNGTLYDSDGSIHRASNRVSTHPTPPRISLTDLGISRDQSSQWQKLAEIPDEQRRSMTTQTTMPDDAKPETRKLWHDTVERAVMTAASSGKLFTVAEVLEGGQR